MTVILRYGITTPARIMLTSGNVLRRKDDNHQYNEELLHGVPPASSKVDDTVIDAPGLQTVINAQYMQKT